MCILHHRIARESRRAHVDGLNEAFSVVKNVLRNDTTIHTTYTQVSAMRTGTGTLAFRINRDGFRSKERVLRERPTVRGEFVTMLPLTIFLEERASVKLL
jgi:hypothetical protein